MPRLARVVVPGVPLHITQRGSRRQRTFFRDDDCRLYVELVSAWCGKHDVAVWAWCLMPNHVHLIVMPASEKGPRLALGEAHRRYAQAINRRMDWSGHLWQSRFASFPMDERHLLAAARYVELNPVRSGLVASAGDWRWSSARAHLTGRDDGLCVVEPLLAMVPDWCCHLADGLCDEELDALRRHSRTGRPLGGESFIDALEQRTGRRLRPRKPGPKAR